MQLSHPATKPSRQRTHHLDAKGLYARAISLLSQQEYCAHQLQQKLQRVAKDNDLIAPLITQLQQQGYLSDRRFAEAFLRSRTQRGETVAIAARKASQKGVDREALQEAIAEIEVDETAACRRLLLKRDPQGLRFHDRRLWQRHLRYLCSKGYAMDLVIQTMQQHLEQKGAYQA